MVDATEIILAGMALVGAVAGNGLFQFLLTRKDKKKEEAKNEDLKKLREEFKAGLDEREKTGKARYDEHHIAIERMDIQHQRDFQELKNAIQQLTENDTKITESIRVIGETQSIMAESLVGMAHDRIIQFTNIICDRECITNKEKSTLKSMYEPYHRLGGNGEVKEAYDYVLSLPTVSEDIARKKDRDINYNQLKQVLKEEKV